MARMISPEFPSSGPQCEMKFWYHMKGQDIGTLRILLNNETLVSVLATIDSFLPTKRELHFYNIFPYSCGTRRELRARSG